MQGFNIDKAINWLIMADKNNLELLAEKAERFLVQAAAQLCDNPAADHIPHRSLLYMLDSRYAAIERMQKTARGCASECETARRRENNKVQLSDDMKDALNRLQDLEPQYPDAT